MLATCYSICRDLEDSLYGKSKVLLGNVDYCKEKKDPTLNKITLFYRSGSSNYCLHLYSYAHNVSADISNGLLLVFVELRSLHETSNHVFYLIHGGRLFLFS